MGEAGSVTAGQTACATSSAGGSGDSGLPPMEYRLTWRMAQAELLIRHRELALCDIAQGVSCSSASAFGVALTGHVGMPPGRYSTSTGETDDITAEIAI